jgi:hypothetical protein
MASEDVRLSGPTGSGRPAPKAALLTRSRHWLIVAFANLTLSFPASGDMREGFYKRSQRRLIDAPVDVSQSA